MSSLDEKFQKPVHSEDAVARCTLGQLRKRWGSVFEPDDGIRVGSILEFWAMGGKEVWRVTGKDGSDWTLERI